MEEDHEEEDLVINQERRDKLIIKINNLDNCLQYLEDNLGIDFLSKLLSKNLKTFFLETIENKIKEFEKDYIEYLNNKHRDTLNSLKAGKLDDSITDVLEKAAKEISAKYN